MEVILKLRQTEISGDSHCLSMNDLSRPKVAPKKVPLSILTGVDCDLGTKLRLAYLRARVVGDRDGRKGLIGDPHVALFSPSREDLDDVQRGVKRMRTIIDARFPSVQSGSHDQASVLDLANELEQSASDLVDQTEVLVERKRGDLLFGISNILVYETEVTYTTGLFVGNLDEAVHAHVEEAGAVTKSQGWIFKEQIDSRVSNLYIEGDGWGKVVSEGGGGVSTLGVSGKRPGVAPTLRGLDVEVNAAAAKSKQTRDRLAGPVSEQVSVVEKSLKHVGLLQAQLCVCLRQGSDLVSPAEDVLRMARDRMRAAEFVLDNTRGFFTRRVEAEARPAEVAAEQQTDVIETIQKLASLNKVGAITDEEFAAKKEELLKRL